MSSDGPMDEPQPHRSTAAVGYCEDREVGDSVEVILCHVAEEPPQ